MTYAGSKAIAYAAHSKVVKRLIDAGLIPAECTRFELVFQVNSPVRATCTFNVTEEHLEEIAKAYEEHPEEAASIVRDIVRPRGKLHDLSDENDPRFEPRR